MLLVFETNGIKNKQIKPRTEIPLSHDFVESFPSFWTPRLQNCKGFSLAWFD